MSKTRDIYADNYVKPRVIPILLATLLLFLGLWAFIANYTIFGPRGPWWGGLGFCALAVTLVLFTLELLHRLWPVRTCRPKNGNRITTFYVGWGKEVERTELTDGRPSVYVINYAFSGGATYIDPRELIQTPQVRVFVAEHSKVKQSTLD